MAGGSSALFRYGERETPVSAEQDSNVHRGEFNGEETAGPRPAGTRAESTTGSFAPSNNNKAASVTMTPIERRGAFRCPSPLNPRAQQCPLSTNAGDCLDGAWPPLAGGGGGGGDGGGVEPAPQTVQ